MPPDFKCVIAGNSMKQKYITVGKLETFKAFQVVH